MAEITGSTSKRRSPRIDMTAMVDVAFLLLSFFVLTATITTSKMMKLTMPPANAEGDVSEEKLMTLRLCPENAIEWYIGTDSLHAHKVSSGNIRPIISEHLNKKTPICMGNSIKDCWDPMFVIKPQEGANYGTLVDVLDELNILGSKKVYDR